MYCTSCVHRLGCDLRAGPIAHIREDVVEGLLPPMPQRRVDQVRADPRLCEGLSVAVTAAGCGRVRVVGGGVGDGVGNGRV